MGKTITITEEKYRELVSQTTTEIMTEHGGDAPQAALLFSLSCIAFSAALARKLFPEDEDDKKTRTGPSNEKMREELTSFCRKRTCVGCPLEYGFECGRGKFFNVPSDKSGYMTDESIVRHYMAMKGAES